MTDREANSLRTWTTLKVESGFLRYPTSSRAASSFRYMNDANLLRRDKRCGKSKSRGVKRVIAGGKGPPQSAIVR